MPGSLRLTMLQVALCPLVALLTKAHLYRFFSPRVGNLKEKARGQFHIARPQGKSCQEEPAANKSKHMKWLAPGVGDGLASWPQRTRKCLRLQSHLFSKNVGSRRQDCSIKAGSVLSREILTHSHSMQNIWVSSYCDFCCLCRPNAWNSCNAQGMKEVGVTNYMTMLIKK